MAQISVRGNIGKDPEIRYTKDGKPVLSFNIAENHSRRNQNGEWETSSTTWWNASLFGKQAENMAEHLTKGVFIVATGKQETREYTTKNGEQGKSLELLVDTIGIIPKNQNTQPASAGTPAANTWNQPQPPQQQNNSWDQNDPWGAGTN